MTLIIWAYGMISSNRPLEPRHSCQDSRRAQPCPKIDELIRSLHGSALACRRLAARGRKYKHDIWYRPYGQYAARRISRDSGRRFGDLKKSVRLFMIVCLCGLSSSYYSSIEKVNVVTWMIGLITVDQMHAVTASRQKFKTSADIEKALYYWIGYVLCIYFPPLP